MAQVSTALLFPSTSPNVASQVDKRSLTAGGQRVFLDKFDAALWLVEDLSTGRTDFDPRVAPMQTFEIGARSCFGTLAVLDWRCLLIMTFFYAQSRRISRCVHFIPHRLQLRAAAHARLVVRVGSPRHR